MKKVCVEHGEGARKHFKPLITRECGPGGEVVIKKSKKMFYVCDLNLSGRRVMQSRLSFGNTPERPSGARVKINEFSKSLDTSKVGQTPSNDDDVRTEQADEKDEN